MERSRDRFVSVGSFYDIPQTFGGDSSGTLDSLAAFQAFYAASNAMKFVPDGTYRLDTQWLPSRRPIDFVISPGAVFTGSATPSLIDWQNVIEFQIPPIWTDNIKSRDYDSSFNNNFVVFSNVFQAHNIGTTAVVVPLFAHGKYGSSSIGEHAVFGGNIVFSSDVNHAYGYGLEIDVVQAANAGYVFDDVTGLLVASSGFAQPQRAHRIQSNTAFSRFVRGIEFYNRVGIAAPVSETYIWANATESAQTPIAGLDWRLPTFSALDIGVKSFNARGGNSVNYLDLVGGLSGSFAITTTAASLGGGVGDANVTWNFDTTGTGTHNFKTGGVLQLAIGNVSGTTALQIQGATGFGLLKTIGSGNTNVSIRGGGSGGVVLQDGGAATKFAINTTGIGLYGVTPVARSTGWATQTATPSKADLGALPTLGALASWASAIDVMLKALGPTST